MNDRGEPETPFEYLGAYGRVAYGFTDAKAHYTLDQRGAWLTAWCAAGKTPKRDGMIRVKPLRAQIGQELLLFLIDEGDLVEVDDETVRFAHFEWCNEPMEASRRASKAYRDRKKNDADSVSTTSPSDHRHMTSSDASYSPSMSSSAGETTKKNGATPPSRTREAGFDPEDPVDAFYLTTTQYANEGGKLRRWIEDVASHGPSRRDFGVVFDQEWRSNGMDVRKALEATDAKLRKMGERAKAEEERAERDRANRRVLDEPWRRQFAAAVYADERGGPLTSAGDVLSSLQRSDHSLTDDESPGRESEAATGLVPVENGATSPSPARAEVVNASAEPGESGPDR